MKAKYLSFVLTVIMSIAVIKPTDASAVAYPSEDPTENTGEEPGEESGEETEPSTPAYSGTVPVIFIDTEDHQPIISKEEYIVATFRLDPMSTEEAPIESMSIQIKGRGNSSWKLDKKPYKLKFDKKTSLLGMPKSKHWALMAHAGWGDFVTNFAAFEFGRYFEMGWEPSLKPVEVVLNGEYIGLYFLQETIKVESTRLNIFEQKDEETDPEIIPYGWLLEIDNYREENQVSFRETDNFWIYFTPKSPEVLSPEQRSWLLNDLKNINSLIYQPDKTDNSWEDYIDVESVAKFFIVQELFDNIDGFRGSCYLYKDKVEGAKWTFGTLWDVAMLSRNKDKLTVFMPGWGNTELVDAHWIRELLKFPHFVEVVREILNRYPVENPIEVISKVEEFAMPLSEAMLANKELWPDAASSPTSLVNFFKNKLKYNVNITTGIIAKTCESIELSSTELTLEVGETASLNATIYPEDAFDPVVWFSSDRRIAQVDNSGHVVAISPGVAYITVKCGDVESVCTVTVPGTPITFDAPVISLVDNNLVITSNIEGAKLHTSVSSDDFQTVHHNQGDEIPLSGIYKITSYATHDLWGTSPTSEAYLYWMKQGEGSTGIGDFETGTERAVMVSYNGTINVHGTKNGETIAIYSLEGIKLVEVASEDDLTQIQFTPELSTVYIFTVGKYSIKVIF